MPDKHVAILFYWSLNAKSSEFLLLLCVIFNQNMASNNFLQKTSRVILTFSTFAQNTKSIILSKNLTHSKKMKNVWMSIA